VGATATSLLAKKKEKTTHKIVGNRFWINERIEMNKTQNCWKSILDQ
jgi:hypothetical protein